MLALFVCILIALHLLRKRSYFIRFMTTGGAAVPALIGVLLLTLIMGLTRQVEQTAPPADPLAFTKMPESWPFILLYIWMTAIVGEVSLVQIAHPSRRNVCSLLSHLGLFVALTCGSLGSADMQRLKMYCELGQPEWRGLDAWDNVHELPLAVELQKFIIDEYPPKLIVVDHAGKALPYDKPQVLEVAQGVTGGHLLGWDIKIEKQIANAMPVPLVRRTESMPREIASRIQMDTLGLASNKEDYTATSLPGTECALLVCARRAGQPRERVAKGWVTCGSYQFMYQALPLDAGHSLVMASREPSRYASQVTIYTEDEQVIQGEIAVNHPLTVKGWKIYQLSYNQQMGKWSTLSILDIYCLFDLAVISLQFRLRLSDFLIYIA